ACNVAILLGQPSKNTFVIDVDVAVADGYGAENSRIAAIAEEVFGHTMCRYGSKGKYALFLRVEDPADIPVYQRFMLADEDGGASGQAIEILGEARLVTAIGIHHWSDETF